MTRHHDRVRAVLLVHGLEADCRFASGERGDTDIVVDLTARVTRVQTQLDAVRLRVDGHCPSDGRSPVDMGADADDWLVAVYDAALAELCDALGVGQSLADAAVCSECERQRVELELLSSVLPLG